MLEVMEEKAINMRREGGPAGLKSTPEQCPWLRALEGCSAGKKEKNGKATLTDEATVDGME